MHHPRHCRDKTVCLERSSYEVELLLTVLKRREGLTWRTAASLSSAFASSVSTGIYSSSIAHMEQRKVKRS
ncbi:hypothetical protein R1flu_023699 [Riccia fluitans]|uniref:Uncharacterized protein n=1 Tax=Riccia fluitans TaxID=41844 RepID=A0ABD1XSR4_9MARC